ncbi:type II toxin-antitoxin system HicB family antitoxin [Mastigocoleus testarum]|uniref:Uncharacterized protein n=1 Tax=Mastigocoleus testarum BC008 TaxID=371196 RepID=A0A0V7ZNJ7_9CYAN|nr:hypothetical protein [Mastigocoleus testarum]KST65962.1 hypothetical protein BC008_23585 [Mastigocoleus testarum BC008]
MAGKNYREQPAEYYMSLEYPMTIIPQDKGIYIVEILDIPGCRFEGENLQELVELVKKYKSDWIKLSHKRGEEIPLPSNGNIKYLEGEVLRLNNNLSRLKKRSIRNKIKLLWIFEQILVLILGIFIGILLQLTNKNLLPHFLNNQEFIAITISGAFGGLLSSLNSKELRFPKINRQGIINFGFLGELLIGIGGAYTIFLLLPFDISNGNYNSENFIDGIKFIAVGVIGGFSGNLITTRAADKVIQQLKRNDEDLLEKGKELEQRNQELSEIIRRRTQEAEYLLERITNDVRGVKEQYDKDADALSLVIRHLDKHHGLNSEQIDLMKEKIKDASPSQKVQMFYLAKKAREENWQINKEYMERTISVFQGLIDSDSGKRFHRNYAQLGYALKDKLCPEYTRAIENFNTAIAIRDNIRSQAGFGRYEINRAICRIMLDENFRERIKSDMQIRKLIFDDLIAGCRDVRAAEQIPYNTTEPITSWLGVNDISLENFSSSIILHYKWNDTNK